MSEAAEVLAAVAARGQWALDDWMRLPRDGDRYEVIDGSLHVSPPMAPPHHVAASRLVAMLNREMSNEWEAVGAVGARCRLVPDDLAGPRRG